MADTVCWAPECAGLIVQTGKGRRQRYCNVNCKMKAVRRNGGKAPTEPFPPLEPGPAPDLHQAAPVVTVETPAVPRSAPTMPPERSQDSPRGAAKPSPGPAAPSRDLPESSADDLDPRKPVMPVPFKPHPMVEAYRKDLEALGQADSRNGQKILEMATKLVSASASPAASANLSKELDRLMGDLEAQAKPVGESDAFNVIRERTLRKLGVVGVRDRLPA